MIFIKNNCPVCRTGIIGFRKCNDGKSIVMMCDECETVWASPQEISLTTALDAEPPEFIIAELGVAVAGGEAAWASRLEIASKGWEVFVAGEQDDS